MNDEHSIEGSGPQPYSSSDLAQLQVRCEQLQQTVHQLQEEKKQNAETLANVQAELNDYRKMVYDWVRQQVREEDWQDFKEEDYTIDATDAIKELERQEGP